MLFIVKIFINYEFLKRLFAVKFLSFLFHWAFLFEIFFILKILNDCIYNCFLRFLFFYYMGWKKYAILCIVMNFFLISCIVLTLKFLWLNFVYIQIWIYGPKEAEISSFFWLNNFLSHLTRVFLLDLCF